MSNSVARFPNDRPGSAGGENAGSRSVSAIDEQAFVDASEKLSRALDQAAAGRQHGDIVEARTRLRELAVKLRDAGYWRNDKHGLRATVSLLWQADRYVSELALKRDRDQEPAALQTRHQLQTCRVATGSRNGVAGRLRL